MASPRRWAETRALLSRPHARPARDRGQACSRRQGWRGQRSRGRPAPDHGEDSAHEGGLRQELARPAPRWRPAPGVKRCETRW
eukprot:9484109-Pyramimonas_sp.AAC.1